MRWVTSSGMDSRSLSRSARMATPQATMSCQSRRFLRYSGSKPPVLEQGPADVDAVVHAVRLLLLEVVRVHRLGGLLLEVDVRGDRLGDPGHALVEVPPLGVDGAHPRIDGAPVGLDALADRGAEALEVVEARLDLRPEEAEHGHLVAASGGSPRCRRSSVSMRWVSWSRMGSGRASWAARSTSRARASWARRSAWIAHERWVDEPRMSAIA